MPLVEELPATARVVAVILAAGAGERIGAEEAKAFLDLGGRSILVVATSSAEAASSVDALVVTAPAGLEDRAREELEAVSKPARVVTGGATRQASVATALRVVPGSCEVVLCHDAARPLASPQLFDAVVRALLGGEVADGAIPVVPVADTMKRVRDGEILTTEERGELRAAQTPQAFRAPVLRSALRRALDEDRAFTDDAAAVEWTGGRILAVSGEERNFKITTAEDLERARIELATRRDAARQTSGARDG